MEMIYAHQDYRGWASICSEIHLITLQTTNQELLKTHLPFTFFRFSFKEAFITHYANKITGRRPICVAILASIILNCMLSVRDSFLVYSSNTTFIPFLICPFIWQQKKTLPSFELHHVSQVLWNRFNICVSHQIYWKSVKSIFMKLAWNMRYMKLFLCRVWLNFVFILRCT